jgi:predicted nucleic acid-binding protein
MQIVSNSSPIIIFARTDNLSVLRRGLIRSAKEILDSFISSGYYISNTFYSTFLEEIGEKEP